jgi:hypothetical protein
MDDAVRYRDGLTAAVLAFVPIRSGERDRSQSDISSGDRWNAQKTKSAQQLTTNLGVRSSGRATFVFRDQILTRISNEQNRFDEFVAYTSHFCPGSDRRAYAVYNGYA